MKIAIGLPAFNEEKNIASIILQLKKKYETVIVCDDGSNDLTASISEEMGALVVKHKKNLGYGAAINSIFKESMNIGSDILVTFDADGQHRIEDIDRLIKPIQKKEAETITGSRFLGTIGGDIPG